MSGGIWILWDDHRCNLDIVRASEQTVTMLVWVNSQSPPRLFSAVYASPTLHKRLILWNNLEKKKLPLTLFCHGWSWETLMNF